MMMTREEKVRASVAKAINAGYEFLGKGMGTQDEALESKRAEGYDVKAWYTYKKGEESTWQWVMYGKMKGQRRSSTRLVPMPGAERLVELKVPKYYDMNTKDLKKLCSEKKINGYGKMTKVQMIEALNSVAC